MNSEIENSPDPRVHCDHLHRQLTELSEHLRRDIQRVDEPQFKALCETSAEVIGGLRASFEHYSQRSEPAWQPRA